MAWSSPWAPFSRTVQTFYQAAMKQCLQAIQPREAELELDTVVTMHIRRILSMTGGKIHGPGGAGEILGVNPNTLRYRMEKLGIPYRKQKR